MLKLFCTMKLSLLSEFVLLVSLALPAIAKPPPDPNPALVPLKGHSPIEFHKSCTNGKELLNDVQNMAKTLYAAMNNMDQLRQSNPWEYFRVAQTFDSFFDSHASDAQQRWNKAMEIARKMYNIETSVDKTYIVCDEDEVWTVNPEKPSELILNLPAVNEDAMDITTTYPATQDRCRTKPNLIGYRLKITDFDMVVLCAKQNKLPTYLKDVTPTDMGKLDDLQTWTTCFYHELIHVLEPSMRADLEGGKAVGGERYRYTDCYDLRKSYSIENPDSHTLFAVAIAEGSRHYWTGTGLTRDQVDERLKDPKQMPDGLSLKTQFGLPNV